MTQKVECGNCGRELEEGDKTCPSCGSTKKSHDICASVIVGVKASAEGTHEAKMSPSGWAILGVLLPLLYTIVLFVIGSLNIALWIRVLIALGVFVLACVVLWIARYRVIMFLRWVDKSFTGKRTLSSK